MKIVCGKETIRHEFPDLLTDESRFTLGIPSKVYFPQSTADIVSIVNEAQQSQTPITVIGNKTGITGGSVPVDNCTAICFAAMNTIREVRQTTAGDLLLTCDPGVSLAAIQVFLDDPSAASYSIVNSHLLHAHEYLYPPDPTEMTASLGGTVATNASGARSFFFGATRKHIQELQLVFVNGDSATLRRGECRQKNGMFTFATDQGNTITIPAPTYNSPCVKNASGYFASPDMDAIDLFIGSEGTLALFSAITIRLVRRMNFIGGMSFFVNRQSAFDAATHLRKLSDVTAMEYFDKSALDLLQSGHESQFIHFPNSNKHYALYWEIADTLGNGVSGILDTIESMLMKHGSSFDDTISGFETKEMENLKSIRHSVPEYVNTTIAAYKSQCQDIRKISTDAALPAEAFNRVIDKWISRLKASRLHYAIFGHLGDYHLHVNIIPHDIHELAVAEKIYETMMTEAIGCGGTVSAEHGIGKLKVSYLSQMYGEKAITEMRAIKNSVDKEWLLNRGNLFEE